MAHGKQAHNHPQHAKVIFTPFGANRAGISFEPSAFKPMAHFISHSTRPAAPNHVWKAGVRACIPLCIASRSITSGIAADDIVRVFVNGDYCVGAIHEETGAFGNGTGDSKLAAFDRVGALDYIRVDPIGLDPVYNRGFGDIYRHGRNAVSYTHLPSPRD